MAREVSGLSFESKTSLSGVSETPSGVISGESPLNVGPGNLTAFEVSCTARESDGSPSAYCKVSVGYAGQPEVRASGTCGADGRVTVSGTYHKTLYPSLQVTFTADATRGGGTSTQTAVFISTSGAVDKFQASATMPLSTGLPGNLKFSKLIEGR